MLIFTDIFLLLRQLFNSINEIYTASNYFYVLTFPGPYAIVTRFIFECVFEDIWYECSGFDMGYYCGIKATCVWILSIFDAYVLRSRVMVTHGVIIVIRKLDFACGCYVKSHSNGVVIVKLYDTVRY